MAKSIPAIITPEVLAWARNLDGITIAHLQTKGEAEQATPTGKYASHLISK